MEIIVIALILFILYREFVTKKSLKKLNILSKDNLGRPESLENASAKLGLSKSIFLLNSFTPIKEYADKQSIWAPYMIGHGMVSNPEYPNNPLFVKLFFRWDEEITIGKNYRLIESQDCTLFLINNS